MPTIFGQLSEVLRGSGEKEFISGAAWASEPKPAEAENALQMGEEHFNLLSELAGQAIFFGPGDVAGHLACALVL